MKRIFIVFCIFGFLLIVCYFIPVYNNSEIVVAANFDNTISQITVAENWKNWYPDLNQNRHSDSTGCILTKDTAAKMFTFSTPEKKYIVKENTLLSYTVKETGKRQSEFFSFTVIPQRSPDSMRIIIKEESRLLYKLLRVILQNPHTASPLQGLKSYLENPYSLYGFPIHMQIVTDTLYLTTRFKGSRKDLYSQLPLEFSKLEILIQNNNLKAVNYKDISYLNINRDSVELMLAIPVDKKIADTREVRCVRMPKGKMLVGEYNGRYNQRELIYKAMDHYVKDHRASLAAVNYERFVENRLPVDDSSFINLELNFPIFK